MGPCAKFFFALLCVVFSFSGNIQSVQAYTQTLTSKGIPVHWKNPKLQLVGNPNNGSGLSEQSFFSAVVKSLQRWKYSSHGSLNFDYWQGTDSNVYDPSSEYNDQSAIYFSSNARSAPQLSGNVLGLTQVWYSVDSGEIFETDIVLNDRNYRFTSDPRDTSGYGSGSNAGGASGVRSVFIENVITHELGHAYGFSHSGGLQSTMLFMESPEQAHLSCDELVAINAIYPSSSAGTPGGLRGAVVSEANGAPVFGAHVLAISRQRGTVLATVLTDRGGNYYFSGLEPGDYFILAEPFFAGAASLPDYYAGMSANICGGRSFGRTLLMSGGGNSSPQMITVNGNSTTQAPTFAAKCSGGAASVSAMSSSASIANAPEVYNGNTGPGGFGVADAFAYSSVLHYRLRNISGHVEIHAMAYSLYSPIHPSLSLVDGAGREFSAQKIDRIYQGNSGFTNYDSALIADGLPLGDYYVKVNGYGLNATLYPAGPLALDSTPFLLVTGSVNEGAPALSGVIPNNARCLATESYPGYSSPAGGPPRRSNSEDQDNHSGFCGTIHHSDLSGGGPGAGEILGWFAPWIFMGTVLRVLRSRQLRVGAPAATL